MDRIHHNQMYSESLKATLNCYRLSSMDSLGGPSGYSAVAAQMWFKENKQSPPLPPPPPLVHVPLLMPKDTSSRRSETTLGGEKISCFIVGGEKRLCLPQILTTVLKDFSISEINRACAELHIYCSRCSPGQLQILKVLGVLPCNTTQCGLITQTDAERLVSSLGVEFEVEEKRGFLTKKSNGIPVYHECFGKGEGIFYPDLYVNSDAPCISCEDCRVNLSPAKFVSHSHRGLEKRTCHWGFDRDNWRFYIFVPDHLEKRKYMEMKEELKEIKEKFSFSPKIEESQHRISPNTIKRRIKTETEMDNGKRMKVEVPETRSPISTAYPDSFASRSSAFKPWSSSMPSSMHNLPSSDNNALIKILAPLIRNGAILPQYFSFPSQAVVPSLLPPQPPSFPSSGTSSFTPIDWLNKSPQKVPNITLDPADQHKGAEDFAMMKHRLREDAQRRRQNPDKFGGMRSWKQNRNFPTVKTEVSETPFVTSIHRDLANSCVNGSGFLAKSCVNSRTEQTNNEKLQRLPKSCEDQSHHPTRVALELVENQLHRNRSSSKAGIQKEDEENEFIDVTGVGEQPKSRLLSSETQPDNQSPSTSLSPATQRDCVASNSPSSIVTAQTCINSPKRKHTGIFSSHPRKSTSPTQFPIVTPVDSSRSQFKWDFPSASYLISSSGSHELKRLQSSLENGYDGKRRLELLHDMVKIKWGSEEELAMKCKTLNDLKVEFNRTRLLREKENEEFRAAKKEMKNEMEKMRKKFHSRIKDATDSLVDLGKRVNGEDNVQYEVLERLRKHAETNENAVRRLEKELLEERDRRIWAEKKIEYILEESREKFFSLMTGTTLPTSHPMHIRSSSGEDSQPSSQKASSLKQHLDVDTPSDDEAIDAECILPPHRPNCSSPSHSSSKDSGVHDV